MKPICTIDCSWTWIWTWLYVWIEKIRRLCITNHLKKYSTNGAVSSPLFGEWSVIKLQTLSMWCSSAMGIDIVNFINFLELDSSVYSVTAWSNNRNWRRLIETAHVLFQLRLWEVSSLTFYRLNLYLVLVHLQKIFRTVSVL